MALWCIYAGQTFFFDLLQQKKKKKKAFLEISDPFSERTGNYHVVWGEGERFFLFLSSSNGAALKLAKPVAGKKKEGKNKTLANRRGRTDGRHALF